MQDLLELLLLIEQKKQEYKILRRPLIWYRNAVGIVTIILLCAVISTFVWINFWNIIFIFAFGLILLFMIAYFFTETDKTDDSEFSGIKNMKALISLKENIEGLKAQLRILEAQEALKRTPQERYRDELIQTIRQYQREANGYRRGHYTLQIFIILFSLLVTGLTSGLNNLIGTTNTPWIAPALSLSVSFLTAINALFRFRDRGYNLQQTADAIEYEITAANLHIFDYNDVSDTEALRKLAERAERLKDEQRKRQQQLEQASDKKQSSE